MSAPKPGAQESTEREQIYQLIPKIMAEVGPIAKDRKNAQQGYAFRGIDDVYAALQGPLSKHGVFYVPAVINRESVERATRSGGTMVYTTLTVAYNFYAPDGSSVRAIVVGEAMDSGDKSANKAMSAALKYAILQIFCIPCEANEDADGETHELAPKAAGANKQAPSPASPEKTPLHQEVIDLWGDLQTAGVPEFTTGAKKLAHLIETATAKGWEIGNPTGLSQVPESALKSYKSVLADLLAKQQEAR
jgi:hypothetical protein